MINKFKEFAINAVMCRIHITQRTETKEVHNPSTHDEEKRTFDRITCKGYAYSELQVEELIPDWTPETIDRVVNKVEQQLRDIVIANDKRVNNDSLIERKLQELGFH